MKKITLLLFGLVPLIGFSQIKIKAGTSISSTNGTISNTLTVGNVWVTEKFDEDYKDLTKAKVGFYVGVGYEMEITEKFEISPELIYNEMGSKKDEGIASYNHKHLSLPVSFNYKIIESLKVGLGFQLDYLIKSTTEYDISGLVNVFDASGNNKFEEDETVLYKNYSFGTHFNISYNFYKNFSADLRYYVGLTNIIKANDVTIDYNFDSNHTYKLRQQKSMQNNSLMLGFSYKF